MEGNSVTCIRMDESWRHYAKLNKPVTKITMISFRWGT